MMKMPATVFAVQKLKGGISVFKGMLKTRAVATAGIIAALYVVLTYVAHLFDLDSKAIQLRFSEALTILPVLTNAAIPGVTVGCLLANILMGCVPLDIALGPVATLLGAMGTWMMKDKPYLAWIPPVVSNMLIVPFVLLKGYGLPPETYLINTLTVGAGEVLSCGVLGIMLYRSIKDIPHLFA